MAIKNLAIAYNGSKNADTALCFAVQMGKKYGAHLTGLHVHRPLGISPMIREMAPMGVIAAMQKTDEETTQVVEARFRKALERYVFNGPVDWAYEQGDANEHLCRFARYFDLMVIGQTYDGEGSKNFVRPEDLVARSGKPVLIVPNNFEVQPFEEYAVVAWDGSRSAARALADAMQILETKQRLDVVTVKTSKASKGIESAPGRDVIEYLKRHGVDARRVIIEADRGNIGPAVIDYCIDKHPDILVMGAYTQTRLREDIFGGVTKHILTNTTVPVLMSH